MPEPIETTAPPAPDNTQAAAPVAENGGLTQNQPDGMPQGLVAPDDQPAPPTWLEALPEALRSNEAFKDKSIDQIAQEYVELKGKVPVVPETPDAYTLTVPEGVPVDAPLQAGFKELAHKIGLSAEQAAAINDFHNGRIKDKINAAMTEKDAAIQALRTEWGDGYQANLQLANKAFAKFVPEKLRTRIIENGEGRDPELIKAFLAVARAVDESAWAEPSPPKPKTIERSEGGAPMLTFPSMNRA